MGDKTVMIKVEKIIKALEAENDEKLRRAEHERRKETDRLMVRQRDIEKRVGSLERSRLFISKHIKAIYTRLRGKKKVNQISEKLDPDEAARFHEEMKRRMSDGDKRDPLDAL